MRVCKVKFTNYSFSLLIKVLHVFIIFLFFLFDSKLDLFSASTAFPIVHPVDVLEHVRSGLPGHLLKLKVHI